MRRFGASPAASAGAFLTLCLLTTLPSHAVFLSPSRDSGTFARRFEATTRTAGIQEALDDLGGACGTVIVPEGTHTILAGVDLRSCQRLIGAGRTNTTLRLVDGITPPHLGVLNLKAAASDLEVAHLGIDGNILGTAAVDNYYGVAGAGGHARITIHDLDVRNVGRSGIAIMGWQGANRAVVIRDNRVENCGQRGIEVEHAIGLQLRGNSVTAVGHDGISVAPGPTDADLEFSRQGVISGNYVSRETPPTHVYSALGIESGFLLVIGAGSEDLTVSDNVLIDNRRTGGDGIGWGHNPGGKPWRRIVIDGNIVSYAGGFGIDAMSDSIVSNNLVHRPGAHGIVVANDNSPQYHNVTITGNTVTEPNEAGHATGIACIQVDLDNGAGNVAPVENLIVTGNSCEDPRGRMAWGLNLNTSASARLGRAVIRDNILADAFEASLHYGDPAGLGTLLIGGNATRADEPYRGVAQLVGGAVAVKNPLWPPMKRVRFAVSRIDANRDLSSALGFLEARYDGNGTLTITSYSESLYVQSGDASLVAWEFLGTDVGAPAPSVTR